MLPIVFSFVCVAIMVIAFNRPQRNNRHESYIPEPESAEAIAAAAAARHPRSSVTWEPGLRSDAPDGWRERVVADIDPAAWEHAKHYNSYYGS